MLFIVIDNTCNHATMFSSYNLALNMVLRMEKDDKTMGIYCPHRYEIVRVGDNSYEEE